MSAGQPTEPPPGDRATSSSGFPEEIHGLLEHWTPEIAASIAAHPRKEELRVGFQRLLEGRSIDEAIRGQNDQQVSELASNLFQLVRTTVGRRNPAMADLFLGGLRFTPGVSSDFGRHRTALPKFVRIVCPDAEFDRSDNLRHSETIDREVRHQIAAKGFGDDRRRALTAAFRDVTANDLSELPAALLGELPTLVRQAQIIQAKRLIGVADDEEITTDKINAYLFENRLKNPGDDAKLLLSKLISDLRANHNTHLYLQTPAGRVECIFSTFVPADRNSRLIELRELGEQQERLWRRVVLPDGLSLSNS